MVQQHSAIDYALMRVQDFVLLPMPHPAAVLLDRLWPRGISKEKMAGVVWEKDATPSTELRQWFHADPDSRFEELQTRFTQELQAPAAQAALQRIASQARAAGGAALLLTGSRRLERGHLPIVRTVLQQMAS
jgi:uncharacterized protein YeaO (DUF488 family)